MEAWRMAGPALGRFRRALAKPCAARQCSTGRSLPASSPHGMASPSCQAAPPQPAAPQEGCHKIELPATVRRSAETGAAQNEPAAHMCSRARRAGPLA